LKLAYMVATSEVASMPLSWVGPLPETVHRIARLGYDGVELQIRDPSLVDRDEIRRATADAGIVVSAVSTGQIGAEDGLYLTSGDPDIRIKAIDRFKRVLALASEFGVNASIGRFRGWLHWAPDRVEGWKWFNAAMDELATYAQHLGNCIVLEPQCRFNTDFLNTIDETVKAIERFSPSVVAIEGDLFHIALEERSIPGSLVAGVRSGRMIYVQLADSNRKAPGWGHINWVEVIDTLEAAGYDGWLAMEFLQVPDSEACAAHAYRYIGQLLGRDGREG
jgi:sugar phosphate isomerase/epimerase